MQNPGFTAVAVLTIAIGIAAVGIGLSAVVNVVLQQWEMTRFGITEPELVGPTAALFARVVLAMVCIVIVSLGSQQS